MMRLEQLMHQPVKLAHEREKQRHYTTADLEALSATVLYGLPSGIILSHDSGPLMGGSGYGSMSIFDRLDMSVSEYLNPYKNLLTIRDFPQLNFQLHLHETPDGFIKEAGFKKYGALKQFENLYPKKMNSYDICMADLLADKLDFKKIFKYTSED